MKKQDQEPYTSDQDSLMPGWFAGALRLSQDLSVFEDIEVEQSQLPVSFQLRCRQAAEAAFGIAKLRNERQRIGFMPLPITEYLQGLARVADVPLSQVLALPEATDVSSSTPESAISLARLARQVGMGLRETLINIRIWFAAQHDSGPVSLLIAHRRSGGPQRGQLEECEDVLKQIESEYALKDISELKGIELEVSRVFRTQNGPA